MSEHVESSTKTLPNFARRGAHLLRGFAGRHATLAYLLLLLVVGLAARAGLSLRDGHLADVNLFLKWMRGLVEHGLGGFYASGSCNYPPLYVLVLRGLGELSSYFDPELAGSELLRGVLRIPACLADVAITLMLYAEGRRLFGARAGLLAGTLYFLNPVSLYNSAYWGQLDSIHSALVLWAIVALNRQRPFWAGIAMALALLQKLQAIVFVPLILFDVYRWKRWPGMSRCWLGTLIATTVVLMPFLTQGTLKSALTHGYGVVGQYQKLTVNAFNLWYLTGSPEAPDDGVPAFLVETVANGEVQVSDQASWMLWFSWRRIAMIVFSLMVALTLSIYSRRHTASARALAAGALGLILFLFLTEMHERYAYPVIALLPLWAIGNAWRERIYVLLSVLMLLNLTVAQPVAEIGGDIAVLKMVLCCIFLVGLALSGSRLTTTPQETSMEAASQASADRVDPPSSSVVISWFCRVTVLAAVGVIGSALLIVYQHGKVAGVVDPDVLYLDELKPAIQTQGYGKLMLNRSVDGGVIHLGDQYYLRGLGTHAPSTIVYDLPEGYRTFRAQAGIDRHFRGSAWLQVYLDRKPVFSSKPLKTEDGPVEITIPLENAKRLRLVTHPVGSKKGDHVDWALARLEK